MTGEPVRAKDVQITRQYLAVCHRPGCTWAGKPRRTFAGATFDRDQHLDEHREEASQ